jgi:coenzyme F420-reducing hydrogenase delta subunit
MSDKWQPRIVGFLCNWCSYAGADLAGTSRISYPENIRIIKVPCSSRVSPLFILKALRQPNVDGVLVSGCHPGDCHYSNGNFYARRKFATLHKLLQFMGIDKRRVQFSWVSGGEGKKWAQVVKEVVRDLEDIGPFNKLKEEEEDG